jgi:Holliday junction DNA helicase RuvB
MNENHSHEVSDVKPTSLKHLVGQQSVIEQVSVALEAAFADNRKFDHALLVGPPGLGKSALASVIAQEMATGFHEVLGQALSSAADLNALLLTAKDKDVVHVDEAHELKKEYQTALYLALDKQMIFITGGKSPQGIPLADFTLLLSTTDEYCLLQPLRDRARLLLRLDFYTQQDLTTVLLQRSKALRWEVHEEILPLIAKRSRGTPRLALRLLQACRRVCRAQGEMTITAEHLNRACLMEQLDEQGCGPVEQKYLRALAAGVSRLNVLSSMLGLPSRTVSQVIEPFLIRAGLVTKDDTGRRQLTALGREHLLSNSGSICGELPS